MIGLILDQHDPQCSRGADRTDAMAIVALSARFFPWVGCPTSPGATTHRREAEASVIPPKPCRRAASTRPSMDAGNTSRA